MTTPESNPAAQPLNGQHPVIGAHSIPAPQNPYQAPHQAPPYAQVQPTQHPQVQPTPEGYPAPYGYPASHGYPAPYGYPAPPAKTPTGALSWALGFLIFLPIPFFSGIISGVAMALTFGASVKHGGLARANARSAANWGLTYVLLSIVLVITHVIVLAAASTSTLSNGFFPNGISITLYFAVSILHVVLVIMGTVKASSGKALRVPFAIPFIRA